MDVTVLMMSYKRRGNLPQIMAGLRSQTQQPKEIIVINNEPGVDLSIDGVTVINCDRNFGSIARPAIGLLPKTSHIMCHDDDLMLGAKAIENFMHWAEKLPGAILGYEGRRLKLDDEQPYSKGEMLRATGLLKPCEIDVVYAKAMFLETKTYSYHWDLYYRMKDPIRDEDICTSLANQERGNTNYLIPLMEGAELTVLSDYGVALSKRENFWEERDYVASDALRAMEEGTWVEARQEALQ